MAIGFGPGSDMMKAYNENRKQLNKKKDLKEVLGAYKKSNNIMIDDSGVIKDQINKKKCPTCKINFSSLPTICDNCGFPFNGSDKEKAIFIGKQISNKGKISDSKSQIRGIRILLWILGLINIAVPHIFYKTYIDFNFLVVVYLTFGLFFIGCGFLTYRSPKAALLIPLITVLSFYIFAGIMDSATIFRGLIWKMLMISTLVYSLINHLNANKIRKESEYLRKQE